MHCLQQSLFLFTFSWLSFDVYCGPETIKTIVVCRYREVTNDHYYPCPRYFFHLTNGMSGGVPQTVVYYTEGPDEVYMKDNNQGSPYGVQVFLGAQPLRFYNIGDLKAAIERSEKARKEVLLGRIRVGSSEARSLLLYKMDSIYTTVSGIIDDEELISDVFGDDDTYYVELTGRPKLGVARSDSKSKAKIRGAVGLVRRASNGAREKAERARQRLAGRQYLSPSQIQDNRNNL